MNKHEFSAQLRERLAGLPRAEIEGRVAFYREMIDDRMEEGLSEEDAVCVLGTLDDIVANELRPSFDVPLPEPPKKGWKIALLSAGSLLWVPLLIVAVAAMVSVYASLWALVILLWATFASLLAVTVGGVGGGVLFVCSGNPWSGLSLVGASFVCAGLGIFLFFGCKALTKWTARLAVVMMRGIKRILAKKGAAK